MAAADVICPTLLSSDSLAARLAHWSRDDALGDVELCQLHQYALWCQERDLADSIAPPLPAKLRQSAAAAFERAPSQPSLLQAQVASALQRTGLECTHEVRISEGYSIDLVTEYKGLRVAVEVDGPSHFLGDSERPNGATLLKRRQLRHFGWPVLPVPYFEFVVADRYVDVYQSLDLRDALEALLAPTRRAFFTLRLDPMRATFEEARASYKRELLANHPDRNPGDEGAAVRTAELIDAFQTIQAVHATGGWQAEQQAARARERGAPVGDPSLRTAEEDLMAEIRAEARRYKRQKVEKEEESARAAEAAKQRAEAAERARERARREAALRAEEEKARREAQAAEKLRRQEAEERRAREQKSMLEERRRQALQAEEEFYAAPSLGQDMTANMQQMILHTVFHEIPEADKVFCEHLGKVRMHLPKAYISSLRRLGYNDLKELDTMMIRGEQALVTFRRPRRGTKVGLAVTFLFFGWAAHSLAGLAKYVGGGGPSSDPDVEFEAAEAFAGARPGFVFKAGPEGLGYYRDPSTSATAVAAGPQQLPHDGAAGTNLSERTGGDDYVTLRAVVHAAIGAAIGANGFPPLRQMHEQAMRSAVNSGKLPRGLPFPIPARSGAIVGAVVGASIAYSEGSVAQWLIGRSGAAPTPPNSPESASPGAKSTQS